jgi:hypothetical protein
VRPRILAWVDRGSAFDNDSKRQTDLRGGKILFREIEFRKSIQQVGSVRPRAEDASALGAKTPGIPCAIGAWFANTWVRSALPTF